MTMNRYLQFLISLTLCLGGLGCEGCVDRDQTQRPAPGDQERAGDTVDAFVDATNDAFQVEPVDTTLDTSAFDGETAGGSSTSDSSDAAELPAPDVTDTVDVNHEETARRDIETAAQSPTCTNNGRGRAIIRFDYASRGRQSANIALWDVSCSYAVDRACDVVEVGEPGYNSESTAVVLSGNDAVRARFDVTGLAFDKAWVHIQARSYATSSTADFDVWSPLYGAKTGGPVDQDFTYEWHTVDWTGYLSPSDDPDLTAIEISAASGQLALRAVEICIE